jgi:SlyX protein
MSEERIKELESRLAFQEDLVEKLNDAVSHQQLVITDLGNTVNIILDRTRQLLNDGGSPDPVADEKPPHY